MEALKQHFQAAEFSKEVSRPTAAPRRASTNRMYNDRQAGTMVPSVGPGQQIALEILGYHGSLLPVLKYYKILLDNGHNQISV